MEVDLQVLLPFVKEETTSLNNIGYMYGLLIDSLGIYIQMYGEASLGEAWRFSGSWSITLNRYFR